MSAINYKEIDKTITLKYLPRWPAINIEFRDLSYSVTCRGGKKAILRDISGEFQSGQVAAILGPSGAGKSTLLNVLAGFKTSKASADVLVNGRPRCMKTFRKMSRYIMQGDLHQPHLTVHEAMTVAANLKLGNHLTQLQKNEVIDHILDLLRLTKATETMCQMLSGGEMKRLSIALELVDNPPVIFLDEPTTGLDALSSSQCISLLRQIALGGRTVVCSIHTPSAKIFEMFDLVYAMAGGQCVYQGNPAQIIPFMEKVGLACPLTYNPADFIVEVSCGDYGTEYIDRMVVEVENGKCRRWPFRAKESSLEEMLPEDFDPKQLKCRSTSWDQFKVLHNRRWKQMWRDSRYIKLQICAIFCVATLVGCLFQGCGIDATKALFNIRFQITVLIISMVIPMTTMLVRFPGEVGLLKREHFNRWFKLAPYYWALVLASAPVQMGLALIYVAITYPISSQPLELMRIYRFSAITIMISLISGSFGLVISSRFRLINGLFVGTAFFITPSIILPTSSLGYQKGAELPLYLVILRNLSYLRFGLEGLFEAIYGYDRADTICPHNDVFCLFAKAGDLKNVLGFHEASYSVSMVVLWLYLIISTTTAYFMIKMRLAFSAYV